MFCQVSSQGVLHHLWHLFEWWPATWRGYIKVAMEETSTSVQNNQPLLEDPPIDFCIIRKSWNHPIHPPVILSWWIITLHHPEENETQGKINWTRLQPGSIAHQQPNNPSPSCVPRTCSIKAWLAQRWHPTPPNPMVNSTSAQFHIRPPHLGTGSPNDTRSLEKVPGGCTLSCPLWKFPSLQRKYICKSWIFQPRPRKSTIGW